VKSNGQIVQTPQQAVLTIPGLMTQMQQAHATLIATVQGLVGAIDNYNGVNLPNVVIQSVLNNAASLVGSDAATLNSLTPMQRLASIRQVVLNLIASHSLVTAFGSFTGPTDFYTLDGLGMPYSDAQHPANPATVTTDFADAFAIVAGLNDQLTITADGGTPTTITLNPSVVAVVSGLAQEPFAITAGTNDSLEVSITGDPSSPYTVALTAGSSRSADQVCANFNAVLPSGVRASSYYLPRKFAGSMEIPAGANQTWSLTVPGSANFGAVPTGLGIATTDTVTVVSGPNAGTHYPITAVTQVGGSWTLTVSGTTVAQSGASVEIGPASRAVRVACVNPSNQVPAETTLSVFGTTAIGKAACITLGIPNGITSQCLMTQPGSVVQDINAKTGLVQASTTTVIAAGPIATAHADTSNASHIVFSAAEALGTTSFAGPVLTFTVTSLVVEGSVSNEDTIALRSGPTLLGYLINGVNGAPADGHVLAVGDVVTATGTTGTGGSAIDAEFGPTLNATKYQVVVVNGGPNAGTYVVSGPGQTALDVLLSSTLPVVNSYVSPTTNPAVMNASFGDVYLTFTSKNTTTASALVLDGSAANEFFESMPSTTLGTTPWFQLPSIPANLQAGDILEFYASDYNLPSNAYEILNIVASLNVIQVDVDTILGGYIEDGTDWQFTVQPVPFARIHYGTKNDFSQVQAALNTWLALPENQPNYMANLNALVNPLLVNGNPTAEQVGAAVQGLTGLYQFLTTAEATAEGIDPGLTLQGILPTYTIEPVPAVDTLIASYTAKGSDAAVDTLLAGNFSGFFGLTAETSSYAGAFQAATRAVAMNDLPVSKMNRPEAQNSQIQSQTSSPDFEYTTNAVTEALQGEQVDPPTDYGVPSNYGKTS
jgi:hypothetical protein